jgi:non-lysosomal glucosylceramidase
MRTLKIRFLATLASGMISLAVCLPGFPRQSGDDKTVRVPGIQKVIETRYLDLLMEKGIYDDRGREIDGRLGRLFGEARKAGRNTDREIMGFVLSALNYSPSNLAGFPACAFDRPVGHTLKRFGHTIADGNIDATAKGSACPVGGIGAGGFERLMSGNFETWFLKPGWMVEDTVWADQFHVFMKSGNRTIVQTLSTEAPPGRAGLSQWAWRYPVGKGDYFALFPKSGFSYEENQDWPVRLAVVQFSPVIPGNYRETSFPVAVYKWIAENRETRPVEMSLLLTWENMVGWEAVQAAPAVPTLFKWDRRSEGSVNEYVEDGPSKAIIFRKKNMDVKRGNAMTGTMAIATIEVPGKTHVHYLTDFDPRGEGAEVWTTFRTDGTLADSRSSWVARRSEATGAALAVKLTLKPKEKIEVPFVIAWDFPYYEFEPGAKYRKKYTEFFGATGGNALAIAVDGLTRFKDWERAIDTWHQGITGDPKLPGWFKQALLNELYVLTETSIWDAETNLHTYLESADYLMYGTFDVDSYCWHVLRLWPELELNNMRFFAGTLPLHDSSFRAYQYNDLFPNEVPVDKKGYYWNTVKVQGMVPHDIGSPRKRPWVVLNAFDWQNGNVWKDLNPKLPLRGFRDFLASGGRDMEFLKTVFRASVTALDALETRFGDPRSHIPLNEGIPDQTYDTWRMKGESAYVGLLWLAALKTTCEMGGTLVRQGLAKLDNLDVAGTVGRYRGWFEAGGRSLDKLWDESAGYYHIDSHTDDIMTDQLFGLWYSAVLGLEGGGRPPIIPPERVKRTLRTIYEKNVLGYGGGLMGAVNGRTAEGKQLRSQQGDEVWVGTAYTFAANCLLHGLAEEGLHTAYGLYHVVWSPFGQGYFFRTPEAYLNPDEVLWNNPNATYGDRLFRAMKYMRPGAIWAVYEALLKNRR